MQYGHVIVPAVVGERVMQRCHPLRLGGAAAAASSLPRIAIGQSASNPVLKFVPQANLTSLDPIWTTASLTENHAYAVYDTLFAVNSKIEPQPQMAEGYTVSDDGRSYLLKLRVGLKFHNGEPARAQNCTPSLQRWAAHDTFGQTLAKFVDTWGAQDDKTVKITLKSPFPLLIDALAKPAANEPFVMPEHVAKTDPIQQIKETIGSGPFRFVARHWISGSAAGYETFDDYVPRQEPPDWASGGMVAHFKRAEWTVIPDAAPLRRPCKPAKSTGGSKCRQTSCRC
jgi:peptide/nickel transport system substrate-binding protein